MGVGVVVGGGVSVGAKSVGARVQIDGNVGGRGGVEMATRAAMMIATRPIARMMPVVSVGVSDERDGIISPSGWPGIRPSETRVYRKMGILARETGHSR